MKRLTKELKAEIYRRKKEGVKTADLCRIYSINPADLKYLIRLVDTHGLEVLSDEMQKYSRETKVQIVEDYIFGSESQREVAVRYKLPNSTLIKAWIKEYKESGCVILEKKKGRPPMKEKKPQKEKPYEEMTDKEKVAYLEKRNLYLEAEAEYLKKLHAVVQARKARQQKKK